MSVLHDAKVWAVRQIDRGLAATQGRFPHYTEGGEWVTTPDGSWTGGLWVGELWVAHKWTGDHKYLFAAGGSSHTFADNVISGNVFYGVFIQNSNGVSIEGNIIGLDETGSSIVANGSTGITLQDSAGNTIGSSAQAPARLEVSSQV